MKARKILALLLSFCLTVGLLPVTALADGSESTIWAVDSVDHSGTAEKVVVDVDNAQKVDVTEEIIDLSKVSGFGYKMHSVSVKPNSASITVPYHYTGSAWGWWLGLQISCVETDAFYFSKSEIKPTSNDTKYASDYCSWKGENKASFYWNAPSSTVYLAVRHGEAGAYTYDYYVIDFDTTTENRKFIYGSKAVAVGCADTSDRDNDIVAASNFTVTDSPNAVVSTVGTHAVTVTGTAAIPNHRAGNGAYGYWAGIAVPYQAGDTFHQWYGDDAPTAESLAGETGEISWVAPDWTDNSTLSSVYWNLAKLSGNTAYLAVKHTNGYELYTIDFSDLVSDIKAAKNASAVHSVDHATTAEVEVVAAANLKVTNSDPTFVTNTDNYQVTKHTVTVEPKDGNLTVPYHYTGSAWGWWLGVNVPAAQGDTFAQYSSETSTFADGNFNADNASWTGNNTVSFYTSKASAVPTNLYFAVKNAYGAIDYYEVKFEGFTTGTKAVAVPSVDHSSDTETTIIKAEDFTVADTPTAVVNTVGTHAVTVTSDKALVKHRYGTDAGTAGYWAGVAVPYQAGDKFHQWYGDTEVTANTVTNLIDNDWVAADWTDNSTLSSVYWDLAKLSGNTAYLAVKHAGNDYELYTIDFSGLTLVDVAKVDSVARQSTGSHDEVTEPYKFTGTTVSMAENIITVTANGVKQHYNANGTPGYWAGFSIKPATGDAATVTYTIKNNDGENIGSASKEATENGAFVYFKGSAGAKTETVEVEFFDASGAPIGAPITYTVKWNINSAASSLPEIGAPTLANLDDRATVDVDDADNKLYTGSVTATKNETPVTGYNASYTVTYGAGSLLAHKNGDTTSSLGYWLGVAIPQNTNTDVETKYQVGWGESVGEKDNGVIDGEQTIEGTTYDTFYFGLSESNKKGHVEVTYTDKTTDTTKKYLYVLDFSKVTLVELPSSIGTPVRANLDDHTTDVDDADAYLYEGANTALTIDTKEKTMTVTFPAGALFQHQNGGGNNGYWLGVAIPQVETYNGKVAATYKAGWGTYNAETAKKMSSTERDGTQTVDGKTYDTFYYGLSETKGEKEKAWLEVTYSTGHDSVIYAYVLDFSKVTPTAAVASTLTIAKPDKQKDGATTAILGKEPTDLVSGLGVGAASKITENKSNIALTGEALPISGWTQFSSIKKEQNGYYVPLKLTVPENVTPRNNMTVTVKGTKTTTLAIANFNGTTGDYDKGENLVMLVGDLNTTTLTGKTFTITVDWDGDLNKYLQTTYTIDLSAIKLGAKPAVATAPVLAAAPLADHPASGNALGTLYNDYALEQVGETTTYTLSATNLRKHANANHAEDYWVGVAIPVQNETVTAKYTLTLDGNEYTSDSIKSWLTRTWTNGKDTYNTLYWGADDFGVDATSELAKDATLAVTYTAEGYTPVTYTYTLKPQITTAEAYQFTVSPKNAKLYVNNSEVTLDNDGKATEYLTRGETVTWSATATNYASKAGTITSAKDGEHNVSITLEVTAVKPDENPAISPATLHDTRLESADAAIKAQGVADDDLYTKDSYTANAKKAADSAGYDYDVTVSATNLRWHQNGASVMGYWVGFAVTAPANAASVKYVFSNSIADLSGNLTDGGSVTAEDNFMAFYANVAGSAPKTYARVQWLDKDNKAITDTTYKMDLSGVTQKKFTVTYETPDSKLTVDSVSYLETETVSAPSVARTGYKFDGWYTAEEYAKLTDNDPKTVGSKYIFGNKLTADVTLRENWTIETYTITVKTPENGTVELYKYNSLGTSAATEKLTPTVEGYKMEYGEQAMVRATGSFGYSLQSMTAGSVAIGNNYILTASANTPIEATFAAIPKYAVTFNVKDTADTAIEGAKISFAYDGKQVTLTTDRNGTVSTPTGDASSPVNGGMIPGDYTFVVTATGYKLAEPVFSFTVGNGATTVDVAMEAVAGGSSETTANTADTSSAAAINSEGEITVTTTVTANTSGAAQEVVSSIQTESETVGGVATGKRVGTLNINASVGANEKVAETSVTLPSALMSAIEAKNANSTANTEVSVAIATDQGSITLSKEAISKIAAADENVTMVMASTKATAAEANAAAAALADEDATTKEALGEKTITSKISIDFKKADNTSVVIENLGANEEVELELYIGKKAWARNPQIFSKHTSEDDDVSWKLLDGERNEDKPGFYTVKTKQLSDFFVYADETEVKVVTTGEEKKDAVTGMAYRYIELDYDEETSAGNIYALVQVVVPAGEEGEGTFVQYFGYHVTDNMLFVGYNSAAKQVIVDIRKGEIQEGAALGTGMTHIDGKDVFTTPSQNNDPQ